MLEDDTVAASPRLRLPRHDAERAHGSLAHCLTLMLDEVDYGVLLVDVDAQVRLVNHSARAELGAHHPLHICRGQLLARDAADAVALSAAVEAAAQRGMRRMLLLGRSELRTCVAVVPLGTAALDEAPAAMVVLGRRAVAENLSVQCFARSHRLTPAETRVLEALCAGVPPGRIAAQQGVRISTVRTQIGCIREKTGARSIRALVSLLATLPPLVPALRGSAA